MKNQEQKSAQAVKITALAVAHEQVAKDWLSREFSDLKVKEAKPPKKRQGTCDGHHTKGMQDSEKVKIMVGLEENNETG